MFFGVSGFDALNVEWVRAKDVGKPPSTMSERRK
jgi:hypothetical protein